MRRLETLPTFPILIYPYPPIPYYIGRGVETHTEHHRHWASGNIYVVHALGRPLYFLTPHSSLCYVHHSVGLPPSNPKHLKRTTSNYLYSIMSLFQATYSAYPPTPPHSPPPHPWPSPARPPVAFDVIYPYSNTQCGRPALNAVCHIRKSRSLCSRLLVYHQVPPIQNTYTIHLYAVAIMPGRPAIYKSTCNALKIA